MVENMVWYVIPYTYMMAYTSEMRYMNDTLLSGSLQCKQLHFIDSHRLQTAVALKFVYGLSTANNATQSL
jgi:hypothetical protein